MINNNVVSFKRIKGVQGNITNVFVDENGIINYTGAGQLAEYWEIEELLKVGQYVDGIIQLSDGQYDWIPIDIIRDTLDLEELTELELEELENSLGCYNKLNSYVPKVYQEFQENLEELEERILSCKFDKLFLEATTIKDNVITIHNYYEKSDGEIAGSILEVTEESLRNTITELDKIEETLMKLLL